MINKLFNFKVGWEKSILAVIVANIISTIFGLFLSYFEPFVDGDFTSMTIIAFIPSIFIEWGVLSLFFSEAPNHSKLWGF